MSRPKFKIVVIAFLAFTIFQSEAMAFDPALPAKLSKHITELKESTLKGSKISFSLIQLDTGKELFEEKF